jgi:hypothetical protein
MIATIFWFCSAMSAGPEPVANQWGSLYQSAFAIDRCLREPIRPYVPHAGDIILESDDRIEWRIGHRLAKTGYPHHSMIVFERPEGGLAILEAGSYDPDPVRIATQDLMEHLLSKEAKTGRKAKRIWIRQRRVPLSPSQSAALTAWALSVEGRRFARWRMGLLMTPLRAKGPVRTAWLGKPDFDRVSYYCAELVTTSLIAAGVLDSDRARPGATFPHDLFFGGSRNYFVNCGLTPINECWEPPARWTSCK